MALPKKGTRKITVNGDAYRWLIRHKTHYDQSHLHIAVEAFETPGATLIVESNRPHPDHWDTKTVTPVTPGDVAAWIIQALDAGWAPTAPGPSFVLAEPKLSDR